MEFVYCFCYYCFPSLLTAIIAATDRSSTLTATNTSSDDRQGLYSLSHSYTTTLKTFLPSSQLRLYTKQPKTPQGRPRCSPTPSPQHHRHVPPTNL